MSLESSPEEYLNSAWFSMMNSPRVLFLVDIYGRLLEICCKYREF